MSNDDMKLVSHRVPVGLAEDAKHRTERGELSDMVREAYRIAADPDLKPAEKTMEQRLRYIEEQQEALDAEYRVVRDELDERAAQIREEKEDMESSEDQFEQRLAQIADELEVGLHVFPDHGFVQDAARLGGISAKEVIAELKERNPGIPDAQFKPKWQSEPAYVPDDDVTFESVDD